MTSSTNSTPPPASDREPGTRNDGEAMPPAALDADNREIVRTLKDGSRVIRPDSEKHTGQAPPEDVEGGPPTDGADFGAEVSPEERQRREDQLSKNAAGF